MPRVYSSKRTRPIVRVIGPSIAYVELTRGLFALIDSPDTHFCELRNWCASWSKNCVYAASRFGKRMVYLHRALLGNPSHQIDHRNGNTLDYRRCNLREATHHQNMMNKRMPSHNKSGHKGVGVYKGSSKWRAGITVRGRYLHLGMFSAYEDAVAAYDQAALEAQGEWKR